MEIIYSIFFMVGVVTTLGWLWEKWLEVRKETERQITERIEWEARAEKEEARRRKLLLGLHEGQGRNWE